MGTIGKRMQDLLADAEVEEYGVVKEEEMPKIVDIHGVDELGKYKNRTDVNLVKIAYYYVQGYTEKDIAEIFNVSVNTVKKIKGSDEFKAVCKTISAEIVETARLFLATSGIKAVKTLVDCLDSPNDRVRLNASTEILNRVGLKSPEKLEILARGDSFKSMSDEQLLQIVKMGTQEILPLVDGKKEGDK